MDTQRIGILEPENFSPHAIVLLQDVGVVEMFDKHKESVCQFLYNKQTIFIRLKYHMAEDLLQHAPTLRYICSPTTGLNHIDLEASRKRGIQILSLRGEDEFLSTIRATPEHIFGLTLALLRNYHRAFLHQNNPAWKRDACIGREIYGNTVGIIGFGRIGKILAKYFQAFDTDVLFYDIKPEIEECHGARRVGTIEELLTHSNIVLLCTSYTPEYNQFFGKQYIDLLSKKYFINASRGECVDEEYLIRKIKDNFFAGIALDVISNEVSKQKNNLVRFLELMENRNVLVTPHIGGATYESMRRTEEFVAKKLKRALCRKVEHSN